MIATVASFLSPSRPFSDDRFPAPWAPFGNAIASRNRSETSNQPKKFQLWKVGHCHVQKGALAGGIRRFKQYALPLPAACQARNSLLMNRALVLLCVPAGESHVSQCFLHMPQLRPGLICLGYCEKCCEGPKLGKTGAYVERIVILPIAP